MVKVHGYVHHFNIRAESCNTPEAFLTNVCAQLIAAYDLPYESLLKDAAHDAGFLNRILGEAAANREGEAVVVVVDALDEVDDALAPPGGNPLFLPVTLPAGVYFVLTTQPGQVPLSIYCEHQIFYLNNDSPENIADAREYVRQTLDHDEAARTCFSSRRIDEARLIDDLVSKSEGNFAYLYYVLLDLKGDAYRNLELSDLPRGLTNYYANQWKRIKKLGGDGDIWFKYKLPVITVLVAVNEAISIDLLMIFSGVKDRGRVSGGTGGMGTGPSQRGDTI